MNYVMIAARPEEEDPYHVVGGCAEAMKRLGAEALVSMDPADLERCDGLILPGGLPDVDPSRYGEALDGSLYVDAELDRQQMEVLARAVKAGMPVLGICRGAQVINVFFGGSLYQDIACRAEHEFLKDRELVHEACSVAGTWMEELYGSRTRVNTKHHQAVRRLAEGMVPCQFWFADSVAAPEREQILRAAQECGAAPEREEDCLVEAFHHEELPILAVQWHPELMVLEPLPDTADPMLVFQYFNSLSPAQGGQQ